ncbi:hypothetical protein RHGRI_017690 [Rhododendron griersonianum]|uniref:Uncharacterized protein n=1 Tax=Rhododendron griersonianum TaxID=479676 RepID=A0AAV6JYQ2_9ERIC|nr:hypothetical protein RHGRI_017690 [Rhododendron griersonianum]
MAEAAAKTPISRRNSGEVDKYSGESESVALMIFGFLEESEWSPDSSCYSGDSFHGGDIVEELEEEEVDESSCNATLRRSSSIETKIRHAVKDALKEINLEGIGCDCLGPVAEGCRNCRQREISDRLRNAGYSCNICKSKWRSSTDIPSGEHTYLEVVDSTSSKRGETIRVVIELNFRAEFEMARASEEYNSLIRRLPEAFVGKAERLRTLIKILCSATKKCIKDKKMHMPPWRKHKYMQAKWLGKCEQNSSSVNFSAKNLDQQAPRKHRASLLTFDFLENMPSLHCSTAIRVV